MPVVHEYRVVPSIPRPLAPLQELAYNLHWSWNPDIFEAFRSLDHDLWDQTVHNPALMLGSVGQQRLAELAGDEAYLAFLERVFEKHREHMEEMTRYDANHGGRSDTLIAYFSAEFGLTECLPLYSGGLGVLSGDHLKSASELGIPLVGVGLLYRHGYLKQYLSADGWQQALYPENDFYNMPITLERRRDGSPMMVKVPHPGREVNAQVWGVQVGRVPLYLLDTDVTENDQTEQFYFSADDRYRLMSADNGARAIALSQYKSSVKSGWKDVRILEVSVQKDRDIKVGDAVKVRASVCLGSLSPDQVAVQVYDGKLDTESNIWEGIGIPLTGLGGLDKGVYEFEGSLNCAQSGRHGFTVRVLPRHEDLLNPQMTGLICWE